MLLALLQAFSGRLSNTNLQKYLFLYTQEYPSIKSYEFVPYKFGCFSFQSYADRRKLTELCLLKPQKDFWELDGEIDYLAQIRTEERRTLIMFMDKYTSLNGDQLIREVYRQYPYYAIKSEIADKLMDSGELESIEKAKPNQTDYAFFTIGYEGSSLENYLNRLIQNNIHVVCDVRKNPISRKYGFSRSTLSETLEKVGIEYIHIPELGIVSEKRHSLNSMADYNRLFSDYEASTLKDNQPALQQLYSIFQNHKRIAITCFEAEYCMCHRSRVANAMSKIPGWQYDIVHI
jgi:uncharacterized protein (DUF488 family)